MANLRELLKDSTTQRQISPYFHNYPTVIADSYEIEDHFNGDTFMSVHRLELRVGADYACRDLPDVQRECYENAHKQIQHMLYREVIEHIRAAMSASYAGQEREMMASLRAALRECEGKT